MGKIKIKLIIHKEKDIIHCRLINSKIKLKTLQKEHKVNMKKIKIILWTILQVLIRKMTNCKKDKANHHLI